MLIRIFRLTLCVKIIVNVISNKLFVALLCRLSRNGIWKKVCFCIPVLIAIIRNRKFCSIFSETLNNLWWPCCILPAWLVFLNSYYRASGFYRNGPKWIKFSFKIWKDRLNKKMWRWLISHTSSWLMTVY